MTQGPVRKYDHVYFFNLIDFRMLVALSRSSSERQEAKIEVFLDLNRPGLVSSTPTKYLRDQVVVDTQSSSGTVA